MKNDVFDISYVYYRIWVYVVFYYVDDGFDLLLMVDGKWIVVVIMGMMEIYIEVRE